MLVQIVSEQANGICYGIPVDKYGVDTSTLKNDVITEHRILFTKAQIVCAMKMNLHYGELQYV